MASRRRFTGLKRRRATSRPLAFEDLDDFRQLFDVVPKGSGEIQVPATDFTRSGKPRRAYMTIGPYLSISPGYESLNVRAKPFLADAIERKTVSVPYDTMSFEIIVWNPMEALVVASHSKIIGSVWLALINPLTIPGWASGRAGSALGYAQHEGTSDAYSIAADAFEESGEMAKATLARRFAKELRTRELRRSARRRRLGR